MFLDKMGSKEGHS